MGARIYSIAVGLICLSVAAPCLAGRQPPERVVVLDTTGFWRMHHTLSPPVIDLAGQPKPALSGRWWLDRETPPPPGDWMQLQFDDAGWVRGPAALAVWSPYLARACLRGKFVVTDPARVRALSLGVGYHGGVVVYVNGKEVARGHMPQGADTLAVLAQGYPEQAFVAADGKLLGERSGRTAEDRRRLAVRERTVESISIPAELLRAGVNVVAVEFVRAPYHSIVDEKKPNDTRRRGTPYELTWNTCEVRRIQLTAAGPDGLVANATRPTGLQVWNSDPLAHDFDMDFGDPAEPLRPIRLVGARNGSFSGKVVVGSDGPLRGLQATASGLSNGGATIPASAVRLRYALPWGSAHTAYPYSRQPGPYPGRPRLLSSLAEQPPAEFPVRAQLGRTDGCIKTPGQPEPVLGAVVPIWVTLRVPRATPAGTYKGTVTIRASGEQPVAVPIEMRVADWTLPDPQDYATWVELLQSPDTLAVEYGVDLWSEEHFELIGRSLRFLNEVGSRVVYVPLICHTNLGNEQSMVRWIRRDDDRCDYDFTVMERYLDMARRHMGEPKIVVFNVWDIYVGAKEKLRASDGGEARALQYLSQKRAPLGEGPVVTFLDPATQRTENVELPSYGDDPGRALWQPLFDELARRMKRRGLAGAMMVGIMTDARPTRQEVASINSMLPDVPWVSHSHHGVHGRGPLKVHGIARAGYQSRVWHTYFDDDPFDGLMYGWKIPELIAYYVRSREFNTYPATTWRHVAEFCITGKQRGIGRIGADFWKAIKDERGQRRGTVSARYPQSSWRNLDLYSSLLAPGPDGPVATSRYEAFREGVQECEARVVIERALLDQERRARLGTDLVRRCQQALDERVLYMWKGGNTFRLTGVYSHYATAGMTWRGTPGIAGHQWFVGSGWRERSARLYELAGQVAGEMGGAE